MKIAIYLITATLFLACKTTDPIIDPALGEQFTLNFGSEITLSDIEISTRFSEVLKDSRCPTDVECVSAGNAKISLNFYTQEVHLNTNSEPKKALVSGYSIELIDVAPYPVSSNTLSDSEYSVTLIITKF